MHFDALTDHQHSFNCVICGYNPSILIMDINRKVCFKCPTDDLQLPDNYDQEQSDLVEADKFWDSVEKATILRCFPDRTVRDYEVNPNLIKWAPFVGTNSRRRDLLYNTEDRKVKKDTGEMEEDCREMTEK